VEYITFIHKNVHPGAPGETEEEWDRFFAVAKESGLFRGGSAIARRTTIGSGGIADITERIGGYMRFDADSLDALTDLLKRHPTVVHGGTIEICEMPKT